MPPSSRQGDLFSASDAQQGAAPMPRSTQLPEALTITAAQLQAWQARIHRHQQPLLHQPQTQGEQTLLLPKPIGIHWRASIPSPSSHCP